MPQQSIFTEKKSPVPRIDPKGDVAYATLEQSRLSDLPYEEAQRELEALFDKNQLHSRVRREFDIPEVIELYESVKESLTEDCTYEFVLDLLVKMAIVKRTSPSTLIGMLWRHFDIRNEKSIMPAIQRCAAAIESAAIADLIDYNSASDEIILKYDVPPEVQAELKRYQYPLPMVVKPKKARNNRDNGYLNRETSRSLVVLKGEVAGDFYETADVCLDHLDRANSVALTINHSVVNLIDNKWSNLDRKLPGESHDDFEKRKRAFQKYDESSRDVIDAISNMRDRFWLTHKYDRRGRVYSQGYHINYQGNEWNKAVIEFANKEHVNT